jgi:ketol-acid reductoisomerase
VTVTTTYTDADARLEMLEGRPVAVIGFGNQGAAQAHNLRDSGVAHVVVGNRDDSYAAAAASAGFEVVAIAEAARRGQVVLLLIPDETQAAVFAGEIAPGLSPGDALVVASGYNVAFGLLEAPAGVDVVMVAPRMIGAGVRSLYQEGSGFPCLVSVERDATGQALDTALAVAKAIGGTRAGAIASSAMEEAALDLFSEQAVWPAILSVFRVAYEVLSAEGFSDEAILSELYLSGEPAEVLAKAAEMGLIGQLALHSQTSQYGQLRTLADLDESPQRAAFTGVLRDGILSGAFAKEWSTIDGEGEIARLRARAAAHPLAEAERRIRASGPFADRRPPA